MHSPQRQGLTGRIRPSQRCGLMSNGSSLLRAIKNLGFSFFENTISLPYLFFPFKKKTNKPTGLRCTPDTCLPEKGGLAIIHCAGQLLSSHIYFSSSWNHLLALASLSCWFLTSPPELWPSWPRTPSHRAGGSSAQALGLLMSLYTWQRETAMMRCADGATTPSVVQW